MRQDMFKVIVERPRANAGDTRKGRAIDFEDMPQKESMRISHVRHYRGKRLNENLAPLKRYLGTQVGRPWNKVYSDICKGLNVDSTVQKHVRDHVPDFVGLHVVVDADGNPQEKANRGIFSGRFFKPFWVHPKTGLLMENKAKWPDYFGEQRAAEAAERHARERLIGPEREAHRIDGIWYWAVFADRPAPEIRRRYIKLNEWVDEAVSPVVYDVITGKSVASDAKRYRKSKRQLSSADLRELKLTNEPNIEASGGKKRRAA